MGRTVGQAVEHREQKAAHVAESVHAKAKVVAALARTFEPCRVIPEYLRIENSSGRHDKGRKFLRGGTTFIRMHALPTCCRFCSTMLNSLTRDV